jgi:hypothetical protein
MTVANPTTIEKQAPIFSHPHRSQYSHTPAPAAARHAIRICHERISNVQRSNIHRLLRPYKDFQKHQLPLAAPDYLNPNLQRKKQWT